jgi:hypothetical protein
LKYAFHPHGARVANFVLMAVVVERRSLPEAETKRHPLRPTTIGADMRWRAYAKESTALAPSSFGQWNTARPESEGECVMSRAKARATGAPARVVVVEQVEALRPGSHASVTAMG